MNSIIFTHILAAEDSTVALDAALHRLGAYLDAEKDTLCRVLVQSGRQQSANALAVLAQLHLEPNAGPEDLRDLLDHAYVALEYILDTVRGISCRQGTVSAWGIPGPASFDTHVRWSAARLEDIVATLRHCLAM